MHFQVWGDRDYVWRNVPDELLGATSFLTPYCCGFPALLQHYTLSFTGAPCFQAPQPAGLACN